MDNIKRSFLKILISSDVYKYIYDEADVKHKNPSRTSYFFNSVKRDLQEMNLFYEGTLRYFFEKHTFIIK